MTGAVPPDEASEAALGEMLVGQFPVGSGRVLFLESRADMAVALVEVGSPATPYRFQSVCQRSRDGVWTERVTGNGPGWTAIGDNASVLTWWGDAPSHATSVHISYGDGVQSEAPVRSGVFFHCRWDVDEARAPISIPAKVTAAGRQATHPRRPNDRA